MIQRFRSKGEQTNKRTYKQTNKAKQAKLRSSILSTSQVNSSHPASQPGLAVSTPALNDILYPNGVADIPVTADESSTDSPPLGMTGHAALTLPLWDETIFSHFVCGGAEAVTFAVWAWSDEGETASVPVVLDGYRMILTCRHYKCAAVRLWQRLCAIDAED